RPRTRLAKRSDEPRFTSSESRRSVDPLPLVVAEDLGDLGGVDNLGFGLLGFALRRAGLLVGVLLVSDRGHRCAVRGAFLHGAVVVLAIADIVSRHPAGLLLPLDRLLVVALARFEKPHPLDAEGFEPVGDLLVALGRYAALVLFGRFSVLLCLV